MNYTEIDPIINEWVFRHGLHLYTQYKGVEIRSALINDVHGRPYKIGIQLQPELARIVVRVCSWDYKKRNKEYYATKGTLPDVLEEAASLIKEWMTSP